MNQETTQSMLKWLNQNRQHILDLYKDQYIAYNENGIIAHDERLQPVLEQANATGIEFRQTDEQIIFRWRDS